MRHQHIASLGALLVAVALVVSGCAQPTEAKKESSGFTVLGSASGRVVGPDGLPMKGVKVTYNTGSRSVKSVTTNEAGVFEVTDLSSGENTLYIGGGDFSIATEDLTDIPTMQEIIGWANVTTKINVTGVTATDTTDTAATTVGDITQNQYWIDTFGVYRVNEAIGDVTLYPLTASVKGIALMETIENDFNMVTTVVPEGFTIGVTVRTATGAGGDAVGGMVTATIGELGAFTIEKLPAGYPTKLFYTFFIVSSDNEKNAVAYKISSSNWHIAEGANEMEAGFIDGGATVNLENITFVAAIAPIVTTVSPSTAVTSTFMPTVAGVTTPLVFTFSKAMNTTKGTLTLESDLADSEDYLYTKAWNADFTVLTVTPTVPFEYGAEITATFDGYESADGVEYDGTTPFTFNAREALALKTWSWFSPLSSLSTAQDLKVALDASPTLTFNYDLTGFTLVNTFLQQSTDDGVDNIWGNADDTYKLVDSTPSIATSVLTIDPTPAALKNGTWYRISYKVTDGITSLQSTKSFETVAGATLATPTITKDAFAKQVASNRAAYNGGENTVYVAVSKAVADTTVTGFTFQYKNSTDLTWNTVAAADADITAVTATNWYYTVDVLNFNSGDTLQVRAIATGAGYVNSVPSAEITFTDEVNPLVGAVSFGAAGEFAAPVAAVSTNTLANNASTTLVADTTFVIDIGGEKMSMPTVAAGTPAVSGFTYQWTLNAAETEATLTIIVNAAAAAATPTDPAGQLVFTVMDKAGRAVDFDAATTAAENLTVNF